MANTNPYRSLPAARRVALWTHAISAHRDARAAYAQRLVGKGGFRAATLVTWSPERLAREIVRLKAETSQDELDMLQLLYVELEPGIQATFLEEAGVKHEAGQMAEELEPPYADAEAVRRAAALVRERHGEDGLNYLRTLARYNAAGWPGIEEVVAGLED